MAEMNQTAYKISYGDFASIREICAEANNTRIYNLVEKIFTKAYKNWMAGKDMLMTLSAEDYAKLRKAVCRLPFQYAVRASRTLYRAQIINSQSAIMSNNQNIR